MNQAVKIDVIEGIHGYIDDLLDKLHSLREVVGSIDERNSEDDASSHH